MKSISECVKNMEMKVGQNQDVMKKYSHSLMQNSERLKKEKINTETLALTEWLLKKLQALFGGKMYKGTTAESMEESRLAWHDILQAMGKESVLETYKFLKTAHEDIPKFAPSPVEFKQLAQIHVMPFIRYKNKFKLHKYNNHEQVADESIARRHLILSRKKLKHGGVESA